MSVASAPAARTAAAATRASFLLSEPERALPAKTRILALMFEFSSVLSSAASSAPRRHARPACPANTRPSDRPRLAAQPADRPRRQRQTAFPASSLDQNPIVLCLRSAP